MTVLSENGYSDRFRIPRISPEGTTRKNNPACANRPFRRLSFFFLPSAFSSVREPLPSSRRQTTALLGRRCFSRAPGLFSRWVLILPCARPSRLSSPRPVAFYRQVVMPLRRLRYRGFAPNIVWSVQSTRLLRVAHRWLSRCGLVRALTRLTILSRSKYLSPMRLVRPTVDLAATVFRNRTSEGRKGAVRT